MWLVVFTISAFFVCITLTETAHKLKPEFEKASSRNLALANVTMLVVYFSRNANFVSIEVRCVNAQRSGTEIYGDSAVEYVQLVRCDEKRAVGWLLVLLQNIISEIKVIV